MLDFERTASQQPLSQSNPFHGTMYEGVASLFSVVSPFFCEERRRPSRPPPAIINFFNEFRSRLRAALPSAARPSPSGFARRPPLGAACGSSSCARCSRVVLAAAAVNHGSFETTPSIPIWPIGTGEGRSCLRAARSIGEGRTQGPPSLGMTEDPTSLGDARQRPRRSSVDRDVIRRITGRRDGMQSIFQFA